MFKMLPWDIQSGTHHVIQDRRQVIVVVNKKKETTIEWVSLFWQTPMQI